MRTITLHGDFATPEMLKRDMGWKEEIEYFDGNWRKKRKKSIQQLADSINEPVVLIGYSEGGAVIAELTATKVCKWICAAVLYESPVHIDDCGGDFPSLLIWNKDGAMLERPRQALHSIACWSSTRVPSIITGAGWHLQLNPPAHCWDRSLNNRIENWINKQIGKQYLLDQLLPPGI